MADFRTANEKVNSRGASIKTRIETSIMLCQHFAVLFSDIFRNCIKGLLFFFLLSLFSSVVSATDFSYSPIVESSKDFTSFLFYKSGFNYISEFSVTYPAGSVTFVNPSNSTYFSIVSGGTGFGTVSYSDVTRKVTWVFTLGNITSNSFVVSYSSNIFNDISLVGGGFDFSVDYDCQAPWSYRYTYRWAQSGPSPVAPVSVSGGGIKYNFPGGNNCGSGYWQGYGSSYIGAINASVSVTAPPIDNANLIVASESPDYNSSISSTDNYEIYLTTWVNNSNWAFWSPLNTYVEVVRPDGHVEGWGGLLSPRTVWRQNAYQFAYSFPISLIGPTAGNYTFNLKNGFQSETIASVTLNYIDSSNISNSINFIHTDNNVSVNYHIKGADYGNNINNIYFKSTYQYPSGVETTLCEAFCMLPGFNGTFSLDSSIRDQNYFSGQPVTLRAYIYKSSDNSLIVSTSMVYQYQNVLVVTPNPTYSPVPTPNMTFGPIPTIAPIANGSNITSNSPSDFNNYTRSQSDSLNSSVSGIGGFVVGTINGMRGGIQSVKNSLASFLYGGYMSILVIVVGSFMAALPVKLKTVYSIILIFAIVLIVMGRDKK